MEDLRKKLEEQQKKYPALQHIGIEIEEQDPLYTTKQLNAFAKDGSMAPLYQSDSSQKFASGILEHNSAPRTSMPKLPGANKQTQISHLFPHVGGGTEERDNLVNLHKQVNTVFMKSIESEAMSRRSATYMAVSATEFQSGRPDTIRYDINPARGKSFSVELTNLNSAFQKK